MTGRSALRLKTFSILLTLCFLLPGTAMGEAADEPRALLSRMGTEQKIAQLLMPSFYYRYFPDGRQENATELYPELEALLNDFGFGGIILGIQNMQDNGQAVRLTDALQAATARAAGRPQLIFCTDQEGGYVTRLARGTQMPGSMALGAINDPEITKSAGRLIGEEVTALGLNGSFAPVADVNNNPANPVIGIRSFSDDPWTAAVHACAMVQGLHEAGALSAIKHFPGHGDTDTDSHTGLPLVNKSYEELKTLELIPFKACVDAGADMVMTAHIVYPQIEKGTYTSIGTGETVGLPATLSRTILTDILRGDLGFSGLIVTDAMSMGAIAQHFDPLDAAQLAIEAGADLLLMPVDYKDPNGLNTLRAYIRDLAERADKGVLSMEAVDAAVLRVLTFKQARGLLAPYEGGDTAAKAQAALSAVGSKEHHELEFEMARRAVTLVKDDGVLPLDTAQSAAVVVPFASEIPSAEYAIGRLKDEGKLPADAQIPVYRLSALSNAEMEKLCRETRYILAVHAAYSAGDLDPRLSGGDSALLDRLIALAHEAGNGVIVISAHLPYDAARFSAADAVAVAFGARGMTEDPRSRESGVSQFGPNIPAALYLLLSGEKMTGRLPVAIPALDGAYHFTDDILYPRGFGL